MFRQKEEEIGEGRRGAHGSYLNLKQREQKVKDV